MPKVKSSETKSNAWKVARRNLAIRGIGANPPLNMSDWGGENLRQDVRWKFGMPPVRNPFSQN
jgi:hypothetical protein